LDHDDRDRAEPQVREGLPGGWQQGDDVARGPPTAGATEGEGGELLSGRLQTAPEIAERYVNARELAALMGVSTRTLARMVAAGMPSQTWGLKRTRRFRPSEAIEWAASRDQERNPPEPTQPKE
jgi:hypothetical protein